MEDQHQSIQAKGWGKSIGFTGPNAFPWLVIVILLGGVAYMTYFTLGSWGKPFPIKDVLDEHTTKNGVEHNSIGEALDRFTYINWICSPLNMTARAKEECSRQDLMRPESMDSRTRSYRIPNR